MISGPSVIGYCFKVCMTQQGCNNFECCDFLSDPSVDFYKLKGLICQDFELTNFR